MILRVDLSLNPCCSVLRHSSDLRAGGSNPSGRAMVFKNLLPESLIFFTVVLPCWFPNLALAGAGSPLSSY
jgi:hypothetical protein